VVVRTIACVQDVSAVLSRAAEFETTLLMNDLISELGDSGSKLAHEMVSVAPVALRKVATKLVFADIVHTSLLDGRNTRR